MGQSVSRPTTARLERSGHGLRVRRCWTCSDARIAIEFLHRNQPSSADFLACVPVGEFPAFARSGSRSDAGFARELEGGHDVDERAGRVWDSGREKRAKILTVTGYSSASGKPRSRAD